MTIAAQNNQRVRPALAQILDQSSQDAEDIDAFAPSAWLEYRGDQFSGQPFVNMQWHKAISAIIVVEQGKLLPP